MQIASVNPSTTAQGTTQAATPAGDDTASGGMFAEILSGAYLAKRQHGPELKGLERAAARASEKSALDQAAARAQERMPERVADRKPERSADAAQAAGSQREAAPHRDQAVKEKQASADRDGARQLDAESPEADAAADTAATETGEETAATADAAETESGEETTATKDAAETQQTATAVAVMVANPAALLPDGAVADGDAVLGGAGGTALPQAAPEAAALTPEMEKAAMEAAKAAAQAAGLDGRTARVSVQAAPDGAAPKTLVDPSLLLADMTALDGAEGLAAELPDLQAADQLMPDGAMNFAALVRPTEIALAPSAARVDAGDGLSAIGATHAAASTHGTQHAAQTQASRHPQALVPPGEQVAVQIRKAAAEGQDTISIKLDPGNLGKVEVTLEVSSDGRLLAVIAADRPETLAMLQKDAGALEQNLRDSGLKTSSDSLSFMLREQAREGGQQGEGRRGGHGRGHEGPDGTMGAADLRAAQAASNARAAAARGGLDIRI